MLPVSLIPRPLEEEPGDETNYLYVSAWQIDHKIILS